MNMAENHMVIGEYDTRPEMTDADVEERILELEEELCNERRESLIEELEGEDFAREVIAVLLSDSRDKLYDINGIFDRHLRAYATWLAEVES